MGELSSLGLSNTQAQRTEGEIHIRLLIDWVGFTLNADVSRLSDLLTIFEIGLGINKDDWKSGRKNYEGYADSLVFENINIYFNGAENQGLHVDFTGQACRFLDVQYEKLRVQGQKLRVQENIMLSKAKLNVEPFKNWSDFFSYFYNLKDCKFTRVDLAADEFSGLLNLQDIFYKCLLGELTMKFKSWRPDGKFDSNGQTNGITLYFGSPDSRMNCVMYEKNKQLGLDYHWTRVELRFKKIRANEIVKEMLKGEFAIGEIFLGQLRHYLKFRDRNENDSNKRRWKESQWWIDFLNNVEPLKIASALPDKSIVKTRNWWETQISRSLAKLYFAYQDIDDNWLEDIFRQGLSKLDESDLLQIKSFRELYSDRNKKLYLEEIKKDTQNSNVL